MIRKLNETKFNAKQGYNAGKLFQRCTHLLYCSVYLWAVMQTQAWSLDMRSIFHIKSQLNIMVIGSYYVNFQNYQNLIMLSSSDTKRTMRHLFLFTNSAQRELVSICTRAYATAVNFPYIITLVHTKITLENSFF